MSIYPVSLSGTVNTLMWTDETGVEESAIRQPRNVSTLPWTHGLRVMPDVHYGRGATAGSVITMHRAVAPAVVGVDIDCGMIAVRTNLNSDWFPDNFGRLCRAIERGVPVGNGVHKDHSSTIDRHGRLKRRFKEMWEGFEPLQARRLARFLGRLEIKAVNQIDTLGGDNHFTELCAGDDDRIQVTLHSGSHDIGNRLTQEHMEVAQSLIRSKGLVDRDLAVLLSHTPQMEACLHDLWWAQSYALFNRDVILANICNNLSWHIPRIVFEDPIRRHHNYVAVETHDDLELITTWKGAIRARKDNPGVTPGSMGTRSYIVRGLSGPAPYESALHGMGRGMSWSQAKQRFTTGDLAEQTRGIECRKDPGVIDEIPAAYKDISEVARARSDLVEVAVRLRTLLCIKG